MRLWVNGKLLIDDWSEHGATERQGTIALQAGKPVDIKLEYFEYNVDATVELRWSSASQPKVIIPQSQLVPAGGSSNHRQRRSRPTTANCRPTCRRLQPKCRQRDHPADCDHTADDVSRTRRKRRGPDRRVLRRYQLRHAEADACRRDDQFRLGQWRASPIAAGR